MVVDCGNSAFAKADFYKELPNYESRIFYEQDGLRKIKIVVKTVLN